VVLTPSYVATLLVKLARVNKDSFVWDFATGSAGLLVAAMNEMLIDAKNSITSPMNSPKKNKNKSRTIARFRVAFKCVYVGNSQYDFDG
jgi:type I restriction-modification system DNA methylase subunit